MWRKGKDTALWRLVGRYAFVRLLIRGRFIYIYGQQTHVHADEDFYLSRTILSLLDSVADASVHSTNIFELAATTRG